MTNDTFDKSVALLDSLFHELAMDDAASGEPESAEERRAVDKLMLRARTALMEARREHLRKLAEDRRAGARPVPAHILAMTREGILARLADLVAQLAGRPVALAHRKLAELPLSDLQSLLADAEHLAARTDRGDA